MTATHLSSPAADAPVGPVATGPRDPHDRAAVSYTHLTLPTKA